MVDGIELTRDIRGWSAGAHRRRSPPEDEKHDKVAALDAGRRRLSSSSRSASPSCSRACASPFAMQAATALEADGRAARRGATSGGPATAHRVTAPSARSA
jgi:hypothetical protein